MTASAAFAQNWPDLARHIGPYGGLDIPLGDSTPNVKTLIQDGFDLVLLPYQGHNTLSRALQEHQIKYVDNRLQGYLSAFCKGQLDEQHQNKRPPSCQLPPSAMSRFLAQAEAHLRETDNDDGIAAFWILDDYPFADVTAMLRLAHHLVQQSNARRSALGLPPRPTMCGFGGILDRVDSAGKLKSDHGYLDSSLKNIVPDACDIVSPYPYASGPTHDPSDIDWSMSELLPYIKQRLENKGFHPSRQMFPIAQAFGSRSTDSNYIMPRSQDIRTQMSAYCAGGSLGLMFFTWRDRPSPEFISYSESPDIRSGVLAGASACRKIWGLPVEKSTGSEP